MGKDLPVEDEYIDAEVVEDGDNDLPVPHPSDLFDHPVKSLDRGRGYLIMHPQGGQSVLESKDNVEFTDQGILVRHNDPAKTFTFYPWFNIVWIREHNK